jgi:RNA polymerase sigma factor (sigma-70 family)
MAKVGSADVTGFLGERERLETLYTAEITSAVRLAYLITGDAEVAHDLAHEAFARLAGRFRHLREHRSAAAYWKRSIVNLANSRFRRLRTQRHWLAGQERREPVAPASDPSLSVDMWRVLHELPHRQRVAIVLRFYEDLPQQEVADLLGCSVDSVKGLVRRGLAYLEKRLEGEQ